jgi:hypothetical protein
MMQLVIVCHTGSNLTFKLNLGQIIFNYHFDFSEYIPINARYLDSDVTVLYLNNFEIRACDKHVRMI